MKQLLALVGIVVAVIAVILLVVVLWREFSAATTSIKVITPEPGIHCTLASTSDGTALSCYPEPK